MVPRHSLKRKSKDYDQLVSSLCQTGSISADVRAVTACVEGREREGVGRDKRQPLLTPVWGSISGRTNTQSLKT